MIMVTAVIIVILISDNAVKFIVAMCKFELSQGRHTDRQTGVTCRSMCGR